MEPEINSEDRHKKYGTNSRNKSDRTHLSKRQNDLENGDVHCHSNVSLEADTNRRKLARKRIMYASIGCIIFIAVEVIGGLTAGSLAILTDAAHLLSDFLSFLISYAALMLADRPPSKRLNWGWHRAEVLGALASVLLIWAITTLLIVLAVLRIIRSTYRIDADIMMMTAGFAIFVNIIMLAVLHDPCSGHGHSHGGHGHSHGGHGHSHDGNDHQNNVSDKQQLIDKEEENVPDDTRNVNIRAAIIHVIGDFFQSLAVFIAAVIIYIKPEYKLADPICTFIFSVIVIGTTATITKDIVHVLMEAKPDTIDFLDVSNSIKNVKGVRSLHDLRIWMITTELVACTVHITIDDVRGINQQLLTNDIRNLVRRKYRITDCTVQIEQHTGSMDNCKHCLLPRDN